MVWANIGVLAIGGALLTLPVILHFLMQPKPKVLEFPALRFVKQREMTNKSRLRLRHFILMLLRCLLILLMAAALAGPAVASREFGQWVIFLAVALSAMVVAVVLSMSIFAARHRQIWLVSLLGLLLAGHVAYMAWAGIQLNRSQGASLIGDSAAPVSALILVDNSVRMDYQRENESNLTRAKELAQWLIGQFPADSQVCVISSSNEAPFFSVDPGAASNLIDNLEIEFLSTDLPSRLASGIKLLNEATYERKEVYVVSDLTAQSWKNNDSALNTVLKSNQGLSIFILDVGQDETSNFSLAPLKLNRETLTRNGQLKINTVVGRRGNAEQRNLRLRIERPDESGPVVRDRRVIVPNTFFERTKTLELKQDSTQSAEFIFSEQLRPGIYHGLVELVGDDSLRHDNARFLR